MRSRQASQRLRGTAFERDRGICAECASDCEKIKRVFWAILDYDAQVVYANVLRITDHGRTFWDADHIIPFSEGGSDSPLNLQTLCVGCHVDKTRHWQQTRSRAVAAQQTTHLVVLESPEAAEVQYIPPRPSAADADWDNEYYFYNRIQYIIDFVNHHIAERMVENGGYWPRALEPVEADCHPDHPDLYLY